MDVLFKHFGILLILILSLFFLGHVLFRILRLNIQNLYASIFAKLISSVTIFIIFIAIYFTKGKTIMIMFIPIIFLLLYDIKNKNIKYDSKKYNFVELINICLYFIFPSFLIFSFWYFQIYNTDNNILNLPHVDYVFYTNCVNFMTHFGYENCSINYIYPEGVNPYHYYDLWLTAGISSIFNLNVLLTHLLITLPIGGILIYVGFCAILETYKKINILDLLFCLLCLTICGISFEFYKKVEFMSNIEVYSLNYLSYPKLFPLYIFTIAAILFYNFNKINSAIVCLLCMPIVFISSAIGISVAVGLYMVYDFYTKRKINIFILTNLIFICLGIFLFYKLNTPAHSHVATNFKETLYNLIKPSFIKTMVNIFGGAFIQHVLIYSPFLFFFLFNKMKLNFHQQKLPIFFFIFINLISISAWAILNDKLTTIQIFVNFGAVSFTIVCVYSLILLWSDNSKRTFINYILLAFFFLLGIKRSILNYRHPYTVSQNYLTEILSKSDSLSLNGAFMLTKEDNKKASFGFITNFNILGNYLVYSENKTFPISLTPHNFEYSKDKHLAEIEKASIINAPFYMFVEEQKKNKIFKSIEQSQLDFINKYRINYLIVSKDVILPELLINRIKSSVVDVNTGERFYWL